MTTITKKSYFMQLCLETMNKTKDANGNIGNPMLMSTVAKVYQKSQDLVFFVNPADGEKVRCEFCYEDGTWSAEPADIIG